MRSELNGALDAALSEPAARGRFESRRPPFTRLAGEEVPPEFDDLDQRQPQLGPRQEGFGWLRIISRCISLTRRSSSLSCASVQTDGLLEGRVRNGFLGTVEDLAFDGLRPGARGDEVPADRRRRVAAAGDAKVAAAAAARLLERARRRWRKVAGAGSSTRPARSASLRSRIA